jgi:hypothetical protein
MLRVLRQKSELSLKKPYGKEAGYIEPGYYVESFPEIIYRGSRARQQQKNEIRWICVPYFSIEEGASTARSAIRPPVFRDTGYLTEGKYFHVAQLWCFIFRHGKSSCMDKHVNIGMTC